MTDHCRFSTALDELLYGVELARVCNPALLDLDALANLHHDLTELTTVLKHCLYSFSEGGNRHLSCHNLVF